MIFIIFRHIGMKKGHTVRKECFVAMVNESNTLIVIKLICNYNTCYELIIKEIDLI